MSYCTREDIESRRLPKKKLNQLVDDESIGDDNDKIPVRVNDVLRDTDGEIESYLVAGGYNLPLSSIPDSLIVIAVDLSVYGLHGRRGNTPEDAANRYNRAVSRLKEIRDSKKNGIDLLFPVTVVAPEQSSIVVMVNKSDSDREFSDTRLAQML